MKMKKFINDPATLTDELLAGYELAFGDIVELKGHLVINKKLKDADRVTVVTYGGAGHEPAQCGYVGEGMLDIQVVGDIFAAPAPDTVLEAIKLADRGHGVLLITHNHAGDMLCGKLVMQEVEEQGLNVKWVIGQEDIASGAPRATYPGEIVDRRGLGGPVAMYHIAGAAAAEGKSLEEVAAIAQRYADSMATVAVAARCATHPQNGASFGDLGDEDMEVGMGQHGEGGGGRQKMKSAKETAELMAQMLIDDIGLKSGDKVFVMINGSGATTLMEMYVVYKDTVNYLKTKGIEVVANMVGEILTVQETAGFQMNIAKFDDEFLRLWNRPVRTAFLTK